MQVALAQQDVRHPVQLLGTVLGSNSTWSPICAVRTFGPVATTRAHASFLPTCAVAGIRKPPPERRYRPRTRP